MASESSGESGPVRQAAGGEGAAGTRYRYIAILHTHCCDIGNDFEVVLSRYPYIPIFFAISGPDISETPDIGFGQEQVCPDIDPIS